MTTTTRNVWHRVGTALAGIALAVPALLSASAASAAPREPLEYDALGDSYASGYGVPPYSACGRSEAAYAVQLDGRMKIALDDFTACAGATTITLVGGGQLDVLDGYTDLVTVTIGGNDIQWGTAVGACLTRSDAECAAALAFVRGLISAALPGRLDAVYTQIAAAAPNAHVVVVGYPRIFSPEYGDYLGASTTEQLAMNDGADLLNGVIAAAASGHGFQFVDVTRKFAGHGVNAPDPYINGPFDPAGGLHPNEGGYQAYTASVTSQIVPARLK
jgi:lysophospholipase L1-like esterase